jgi:endonuclease/exonuclease/phosphatase family metal-dependent hydrolase
MRRAHVFPAGAGIAVLLALAGCAGPQNYVTTNGPRYAGCCVPVPTAVPESLRIVSYNIKFSQNIDNALEVLQGSPELARPDVVFLQEMEEHSVHRIARALKLNYVYWPATLHPLHHENFGNAILARWPITGDRKIILPHLGQFGHTQRIAITGTIRVGNRPIRLYGFHLATGIELGPARMRDQVHMITADADSVFTATGDAIVMAGDTNKPSIWRDFQAAGYSCLTTDLGPTTTFFDLDHVFVRGLPDSSDTPAGVVDHPANRSDHKPIWLHLAVPTAPLP